MQRILYEYRSDKMTKVINIVGKAWHVQCAYAYTNSIEIEMHTYPNPIISYLYLIQNECYFAVDNLHTSSV